MTILKNHMRKNIKKYKLDVEKLYDSGALFLLKIFKISGYEAYLVGGCVRDLLLGKKPNDWDITTSAQPKEICGIMNKFNVKIFNNSGIKYGTISAIIDSKVYEITTFRKDIYGKDSHLPRKVIFTKSLKEDLSRRDFTVNAIASDIEGCLYDYFGGQFDLEKNILKTVGDPRKRFCEDALRLFRACRFLGQLNFNADEELIKAMPYAFSRVSGLSLERVKSEINKLLLSEFPSKGFDLMVKTRLNETRCRIKKNGVFYEVDILPELTHLVDLPQMKKYHRYDVWKHSLVTMDASLPLLVNRWASLLHDIGKGIPGVRAVDGEKITDYNHDVKGAEITRQLFIRWEMPKDFTERVFWIVRNHMKFHFFVNNHEANRVRWIRRLVKSGDFKNQKDLNEAFLQILDVCKSDVISCGKSFENTKEHFKFYKDVKKIIFSIPISTKDLKLNNDIINALKPCIGNGLNKLLERVQNGTLNNDSESLFNAAKRYRRRQISENT